MLKVILLVLPLAGCSITDGIIYTRSDVDALNAEIACRNIARTMVQAQRCGVKR